MDSHSKVIERAEMMIKCMRIARELIEARIELRDRIRSSECSFFGDCVVIDDAGEEHEVVLPLGARPIV